MFIGHFSVALAAKKAAPKTSLAVLVFAALFLDVLWPVFLTLGWEHVRIVPGDTVVTPLDLYDYPISHSLIMTLVWAILFGSIYLFFRKQLLPSCVIGACVLSHWILDYLTHRPDMPIFLNGPYVGLGLWNSVWGTVAVEVSMFIGGVIVYIRTTKAENKSGHYAMWAYFVLLVILYIGDLIGPPPPDVKTLIIMSNIGIVFIFWAFWFDRNRSLNERKAL
jgi:hypothetical protein